MKQSNFFTPKQNKLLYEIIDKYCSENKAEFRKNIKSFIVYDRFIHKNRIIASLKKIFNHD